MTLTAVDALIRDESPSPERALAVIDAPGLVAGAREHCGDVRVWCDDLRDAQQVPPDLLVDHPRELSGVDVVWAHLPKSLDALDEQAASVQGAPEVTWLSGALIKHLNRSMNDVLARHFIDVSASLGRQKARVLRATGPRGTTSRWPVRRHLPDLDLTLAAHGATFAGTRVDRGTRLLLDHLRTDASDVLDLGCGNGVIAATLARRGHRVQARDVSWSAVAATRETATANGLNVDVSWADGLDGVPDASLDAIVTNPPFHRGVAKDSSVTLSWFSDAARVLRPGGELWCVWNSHLPYLRELRSRLGATRVVAQDRSYTVTLTQI